MLGSNIFTNIPIVDNAFNVGIGSDILNSCNSVSLAVCVGNNLYNNITENAYNNIALGSYARTYGNDTIYIGISTGNRYNDLNVYNNCICIGTNVNMTASNQIRIGNTTHTTYIEKLVIGSPSSGQILQKQFHSQSTKGNNFLSENMGIIDQAETVILNIQFVPKSNNSSIRFTFDVSWRVIYVGREGNDDYRTDLYISRNLINQEPSRITTLGRKRYKLYGNDANKVGRNSSNMLFPISGVYNNTDLDSKSFQVVVF
jgi:hypothetical protein